MRARSEDSDSRYELVVGLEVHIQLSTATKIFSADSTTFGAEPNEHTHPVSLGLPGTLPRINKTAVEYAVKMGLATNCGINRDTRFDRKNYFYADLPKGYQITQDAAPVCVAGELQLTTKDNSPFTIRINRIHIEEDAGKSMHDKDEAYSLIDLNRAGVPLIELVTEPDLRSAEQAALFLSEIRRIARYIGVSDGNMEEGSLRCDANISIRRKGDTGYGNRCEVKNLNSIRNLQRAISFEFQRQLKLAEAGAEIRQNTLTFDAQTGETSVLRSKEMAFDYRYFPDPDLQPLHLEQDWIDGLAAALPALPLSRKYRYRTEFGLSDYDAAILVQERGTADYFEQLTGRTKNYKAAANWIIGPVQSWLNETGRPIGEFPLAPTTFSELIDWVDGGKISQSAAVQHVFPALLADPASTITTLVSQLNLLIDTTNDDLGRIIDEVLNRYPEKVREYKGGKKGIAGLFMGELMKQSGGKIDPAKANQLLNQKLTALK